MIRVTAAEFRRRVDYYEDRALTEPVEVAREGDRSLVLLSAEEYERLRSRRRVMLAGEFSDEDLAAIAKAEVPPEFAHLDAELDEK